MLTGSDLWKHSDRCGDEFETNGTDYLRTLAVQEAVYESDKQRLPVTVEYVNQ